MSGELLAIERDGSLANQPQPQSHSPHSHRSLEHDHQECLLESAAERTRRGRNLNKYRTIQKRPRAPAVQECAPPPDSVTFTYNTGEPEVDMAGLKIMMRKVLADSLNLRHQVSDLT